MSTARLRSLCLSLVLGACLPAAVAGKPQWVEDGHHKKENSHRGGHDDEERRSSGPRADASSSGVSVQIQIGGYFREPQRRAARDYYEPRWRAGKCPPGLAKKGNGCQPPGEGQAMAARRTAAA